MKVSLREVFNVTASSELVRLDNLYGVQTLRLGPWSMDQNVRTAPEPPPSCAYCGCQFVLGKIPCGCGANRPKAAR